MPAMSGSYKVAETICEDLLTRLHADASAASRAFSREAQQLLRTVHGWTTSNPTAEERAGVLAQVMDLHRAAREYLTDTHVSRS